MSAEPKESRMLRDFSPTEIEAEVCKAFAEMTGNKYEAAIGNLEFGVDTYNDHCDIKVAILEANRP